jgi:signal peptidase I
VLLPGSGHIYSGKRKIGLVLTVVYTAAICILRFTRAAQTYWGLIGTLWIIALIALSVSAHCLLQLRKTNKGSVSIPTIAVFASLAMLAGLYTCRVVVWASGFQTFSVPSSSMEPTIATDETIIGDMNYYKTHSPSRGDVALYETSSSLSKGKRIMMVKRIAAIGGDSILIKNAVLFVNGVEVEEPFIKNRHSEASNIKWLNDFALFLVPAQTVFVLGDNRPYSLDSRSPDVGPIPQQQLKGRALYILKSVESKRQGNAFY